MGTAATNDRYEDALARYNGGDFQAARELALQGLADEPKDVNLLRLAGKSSAELDLADATGYLEQAVDIERHIGVRADPDHAVFLDDRQRAQPMRGGIGHREGGVVGPGDQSAVEAVGPAVIGA